MDFAALEDLSSAGGKVIRGEQKTMNRQGKMAICIGIKTIMEVFAITNFINILAIE